MMSESTCETKGYRLSFLELFQQYGHIEIPLIQRDYAQGRESAKAVRDRFLDSLLAALKNENDHRLSLDFIYGEVVSEAEGKFQPIDGQQRLTTLFLLHWYLACVAGKREREDFTGRLRDGKTPRFRYAVRKSSDQFFDKLVDFSPDLSHPLSAQVTDQAWFIRAWKHDATIQGALVMLDAIKQWFDANIVETKKFYNNLCSNECPITFDILNLGRMGLSDEIYIKMNARGKELTGFEKFKAWLIENHWEKHKVPWPEDAEASKQWPILLDGDWLDFFWSFRPSDSNPSETVSKVFFRTVLALAVNFHASKNSYTSENPLPKEWMDDDSDDRRNLWDNIFTAEALSFVFENLQRVPLLKKDGIKDLRKSLIEKGIPFDSNCLLCSSYFEGDSKPGFKERLWLHALCVFLEFPQNLRDESFRDDWFRVIRNLIENSNFEQKEFANAVQSILNLAEMVKCQATPETDQNRPVLCALKNKEFQGLKVFDGEQKKEEAKKAEQMLDGKDGSEWEKAILEAERHPVFLGQIGFLLDGEPKLEDFQKRWAVVKDLINDEGSRIGKDEYLLARAALSQCESIQLDWQQNLEFKDTAGQWKYLLGSTALEAPKGMFRQGMLKLIDSLKDCEAGEFKSNMETLCQKSTKEDWMGDVIRYGGVLLQWEPGIWISREQKVKNYRNNGTFIFHKTNSLEQDIMLGEQARWRNVIIQLLLAPDCGLSIDECRKVPIDAVPPFYRGHQFYLQPKNQMLWRIHIQYRQIVLQQRNTDLQSSTAETWNPAPVCSFKFSESPSENTKKPDEIAKCIKEKINPIQNIMSHPTT